MNISLVPLDIYKIPKHCSDVLVAQNFLYTVQHILTQANETQTVDDSLTERVKNFSHAIGIVSGSFSNLNISEESVTFAKKIQFLPIPNEEIPFFLQKFDESSYIGYFHLNDELVVDIHRIVPPTIDTFTDSGGQSSSPVWSQGKKGKLTQNYRKNMKKLSDADDVLLDDDRLLNLSFPRIELDKCLVVTNRNVYLVEMR